MNKNSAKQILDSIKHILSMYKIDIDPSFNDALSTEDVDYDYLLQKTQEKIKELDLKAEEILSKTGMSKEQMDAFTNNPNNFSPEEWQALEKVRSSCDEYKKETEALLDQVLSEKQDNPKPQNKNQKPLTKKNKKKNWIPL